MITALAFRFRWVGASAALCGMAHRDLDVLDAAERAAEDLNNLIDRSPRRLPYVGQMRRSVQAISASISEAFGRRTGPERTYRLEVARSEAEETIEHLRANYRTGRIPAKGYWPLHNLLSVIVKMLNSLLYA